MLFKKIRELRDNRIRKQVESDMLDIEIMVLEGIAESLGINKQEEEKDEYIEYIDKAFADIQDNLKQWQKREEEKYKLFNSYLEMNGTSLDEIHKKQEK